MVSHIVYLPRKNGASEERQVIIVGTPPPLSAGGGGGWTFNQILKIWLEGTWQDLNFYRVVAGKEGGDFFRWGGGVCNFPIKNKLKSEIFNNKKIL